MEPDVATNRQPAVSISRLGVHCDLACGSGPRTQLRVHPNVVSTVRHPCRYVFRSQPQGRGQEPEAIGRNGAGVREEPEAVMGKKRYCWLVALALFAAITAPAHADVRDSDSRISPPC